MGGKEEMSIALTHPIVVARPYISDFGMNAQFSFIRSLFCLFFSRTSGPGNNKEGAC